MPFTPLTKQQRAEWREMLNPADSAHLGAAAALFLLSALALPLSRFEAVAGLYLIYAAVFYYMLTHAAGPLLAIAVPGVLLFGVSALAPGLPHPYLMPAVYAALVLGGVGGSFLLIHCRRKAHLAFLALPVAAYAIAAVVTDPLAALLVLIPVALSLVLGHGVRTCRPQTPVLVTLAAVLALSGVVLYLVWYWLVARVAFPAPDPLTYFAGLVRDGIAHAMRSLLAVYEEAGVSLMDAQALLQSAGAVFGNVLVGFFLAGCGVLSFIIYRAQLRVLVAWGTLSRVPLRVGAMTVSPLASALFLFSYTAGILGAGGVFGTVCENLALVLQPALVLVGVTALMRTEKGKRSTLSFLLLIGMVVLFFNLPSLALTAAAFVGAVRILIAALATRKKDNK